MNIFGPIRKGGTSSKPSEPRPIEKPMGQIPTTLVQQQCWSCGNTLMRNNQKFKGLCDECQNARNKAMDDKIIPDDRGTF